MSIGISFVGTISAGKTTLLNALCTEDLGETHIQKTTLLPHIYNEVDTGYHDKQFIKDFTEKKSNEFREKQFDKLEELEYNIKKLTDFLKFKENIKLRLYDIPGLNDSETKNVYYKYLDNIFKKINIVVWTIDVNSSINTSDELDICNQLINGIKTNFNQYKIITKLVILLNKCDEMYIDSTGKLVLDSEKQDMFNQAKRMIDERISKLYPECKYDIIPISSENTYIYRMIQKVTFGKIFWLIE